MRTTTDLVTSESCLLADGPWGSEFLRMGLQPGSSPEQWNLLHPEKVLRVAQDYVEAGARVILTNTFGGNSFRLARHNLKCALDEINRRGAEISREAAGDRALVFGSMGPTGKLLAMRKVSEADVFSAFRQQADSLSQGGVDALLIETMGELQELRAAARAAREVCSLPLVLSMTFDSGNDKTRTMMGVTPEQAVDEMQKLDAWMVGANCGIGPEFCVNVCKRMRAVTSKPIWVKPNAGLPSVIDGRVVYAQTPEIFGPFALLLREAGANVIGGCCGTTPDHIRHMSRFLAMESGL